MQDNSERCGVYGSPPADLADSPSGAVQLSPLMPGAFDLAAAPPASFGRLLIAAPPGTVERRHVLALALAALAPGGTLTALAPKDKGGLRIAKELTGFGCLVGETARRHYRICETLRPEAPDGLGEAIADGALRPDAATGLWTQPGVFSWDRIDPGTALLIAHLPALSGRGADLGCGVGVLGLAALASPKVTGVHLIDVDRRAVEAAKRNVPDARADVRWADALADGSVPDGLDFVVMNPPFHDGGIEDKALGQGFIRRAAALLRPGGMLYLTANRHLPYEAVLQPLFKTAAVKVESGGYKVFEARR